MTHLLKRFEPAIKIAFVVLIILFLVLYLRDIDYSKFSHIHLNWWLLTIATLISLAFRYWGVFIWRYILKDLGAHDLPPFINLSDVYAKAWMARYIPGTIAWIAGKIHFASKYGISKSRLAVSSLLEGGMQITASLAVSLLILGLDPRLNVISKDIKLVMVLIGLSFIIMLFPPIFNRVVGMMHRIVKRQPAGKELRVNGKAIVRSFILYSIGTLIMGSSYYFLTASLTHVTPDLYFYFVGAFTLSGALGMATPFVPSGLGVRDGAQLVLLSIIFPKEVALVITVFSRLWSVAVDILFYLTAKVFMRSHKVYHK